MLNVTNTESLILGQVKLGARIEAMDRRIDALERRLTIRTDALAREVAILTRRLQPMAAAQAERIIWALDSRIRRLEGRQADPAMRRAMQKIAEAATAPRSVRHARAETVIAVIETHFGLDPGTLTRATRERRHSLPRQIAYTLLYRDWGFSLKAVGRLIGRDHSSVMSGMKALDRKIATSPQLAHDVREIRETIIAHIQLAASTDTP